MQGLQLLGWSGDVERGKEPQPILYRVAGLSPEDNCIIGYAGMGFDGKRKWYLHWYRNGEKLQVAEGPYDSPEEALEVAAGLNPVV